MKDQLQAIVTVLSLVNPVVCAMLFVAADAGRSRRARIADATKAALAVFVILAAAALAGTRLLDLFGISLSAFMVAGGGVLVWMGFSMLRGPAKPVAPHPAPEDESASLASLILFAASPGTLTGVITVSAAHTRLRLPVTALVAVAVAVAVMWIVMLAVARAAGKPGRGGFVRDTVTHLMGLIVLAMGVQFALTGIHEFTAP